MAAHKCLIKALAVPNYTAIFISLSLDDAKEKLDYAFQLYLSLQERMPVPDFRVKSRMEFSFKNGSRLLCVFTPRGKARSELILDEFAHHQEPRKLWQAAIPIMIHPQSRVTVMSTPLHSWTMFHSIFQGEEGKFKNFTRKLIQWWDCPFHCNNVEEARRKIVDAKTGERVLDTDMSVRLYGSDSLKEIHDGMLTEDFQQEFELREIDDETSLLPWDIITACTPTGEAALERIQSIYDLQDKLKGRSGYAGYDVGRYKDKGELRVGIEEDGIIRERLYQTFDNVPFESQEHALHDLMTLPNMERIAIDATGMGEQMAENLERRWGHRVLRMKFSGPVRSSMATMMKMYMEKHRVEFLADRDATMQMHSVKKAITDAGNVTLVVAPGRVESAGRKHHADKFWARALMIWGHADAKALGKPRVRFV